MSYWTLPYTKKLPLRLYTPLPKTTPMIRNEVPNLRLSEYLTGGDTLEGAGLQDTLTFAIKREQQSIEFYSRLMSVLRDTISKRMCERLAREELKHKFKLEKFYDDLFYGED